MIVRYMSCDYCGLYDLAERFLGKKSTPELYAQTMECFGYEEDAENNIGIGIVCPCCGNHTEFDFFPDGEYLERNNNFLEEIVKWS